uniref:Neuronal-specific septin-3-like n=1 Tax=Sinocyclocheilus rhinocerous TaxID=307959 RepID=A0A673KST9_9TELE
QEQGLDLEPPVRMEEEKEVMEEIEVEERVVEIEHPLPCLSESDTQAQEQGLDLEPPVRMEEEMEVMEEREVEERVVEIEHPLPCLSESDTQGIIKGRDLFGYVGIEAVLDQMRRKTMKAGFEFNIMVVGQSGLGKSTLVNTLFKSKVSRKSCTPNYEEKISKTVHLQSVSHVIEEKGVKMKLTVIDTPGFGDQINNENCWEPIVKYVNEQYEKYLKEELHVNRKRRIPDTRIHCCVYFLPATGHWLRPIDVEFMRRLGKIVSIVPVIAKADTLTLEERLEFKQRIRQDLQANGIRVYPQKEYDEDAEDRILNDKIRENIPFAVVGTDKEHQVNGNKVLGRKTKWGIIEVENVAHCEFAHLRDLLIRSHLQDLKDVTHNIHYEAYRVKRLNESNANGLALSPLTLENGTLEKSDAESHL